MNSRRHPSERICTSCNMNICEDEMYFLMICPNYIVEGQLLIDPILTDNQILSNMSIIEYLFDAILLSYELC